MRGPLAATSSARLLLEARGGVILDWRTSSLGPLGVVGIAYEHRLHGPWSLLVASSLRASLRDGDWSVRPVLSSGLLAEW